MSGAKGRFDAELVATLGRIAGHVALDKVRIPAAGDDRRRPADARRRHHRVADRGALQRRTGCGGDRGRILRRGQRDLDPPHDAGHLQRRRPGGRPPRAPLCEDDDQPHPAADARADGHHPGRGLRLRGHPAPGRHRDPARVLRRLRPALVALDRDHRGRRRDPRRTVLLAAGRGDARTDEGAAHRHGDLAWHALEPPRARGRRAADDRGAARGTEPVPRLGQALGGRGEARRATSFPRPCWPATPRSFRPSSDRCSSGARGR